MNRLVASPASLLLLLIRGYQRTLSRLLGPVCRFEPSCSRYTATCIERFGALSGSWLGLKRIARCNPWHAGGVDLPPELHQNAALLTAACTCSQAHAAEPSSAPSSLQVRSSH